MGWHEACGILVPRPGIELSPPPWEQGVLTTGPPGNPPFFLFFCNWSIVDIQCCVSFRYLAKWFSYIKFSRFFSLIDYYRILSTVPCAYTVCPCWLSIICIVVCTCESQTPNLFSLLSPFSNHKLSRCHYSFLGWWFKLWLNGNKPLGNISLRCWPWHGNISGEHVNNCLRTFVKALWKHTLL